MQRGKINSGAAWQKAISLSLALALVFITALQAAHHHSNSTNVDADGHPSYSFPIEKCVICDYLTSEQGKQTCLFYPVAVTPTVSPVTLLFNSHAAAYASTLRGFINKGPPATASPAA